MTDTLPTDSPLGYNVAFYPNRNGLEVDRTIDFEPIVEPIEWQSPEDVVGEDNMDAYRELCKIAVGLTTRIIYLPPETNYSRSLLVNTPDGVVHRPTGTFMHVNGNNFRGDFDLADQDFAHYGLAFNGTDESYLQVGHHASVGSHITINPGDRYYSVSIGPNVCLMDMGGELPTRVAGTDFLESWVEKILRPLEGDIKARAYEWVGDSKTIPSLPERIV